MSDGTKSLVVFEKDFQAFMELLNLAQTVWLVGEVWEAIKGATNCDEERTLLHASMTVPPYQ